MTTYIYDLPNWPNFHWDADTLAPKLALVRYKQGGLIWEDEMPWFRSTR